MGRADRAERRGQLALHGVARGLAAAASSVKTAPEQARGDHLGLLRHAACSSRPCRSRAASGRRGGCRSRRWLVGHPQAALLQRDLQLVRRDELVPAMACRRGSQRSTYSAPTIASAKLFSVRLSVAAIISPPGFTISAQRRDEQLHVGDVLDHLHRQHDVEALAGVGQRLGGGARGSRSQARLASACSFAAAILVVGRIGADHRRAEPRQRLATGCRRRSRCRGCAAPSGNRAAWRRARSAAAAWSRI